MSFVDSLINEPEPIESVPVINESFQKENDGWSTRIVVQCTDQEEEEEEVEEEEVADQEEEEVADQEKTVAHQIGPDNSVDVSSLVSKITEGIADVFVDIMVRDPTPADELLQKLKEPDMNQSQDNINLLTDKSSHDSIFVKLCAFCCIKRSHTGQK